MNDQTLYNRQSQEAALKERCEANKAAILASRLPTPASFNLKKRVGKGKGTFVERDLYESDAFLALSGVAPQMLIYLLGKRIFKKTGRKDNKHVCVNEDELTLTYIELEELGITQPRATRGFDSLLAKGFLELAHLGGAYQKDKSIYALSNKWRFWKKGMVIFKRPRIIKRGFQGNARRIKHRLKETGQEENEHTEP